MSVLITVTRRTFTTRSTISTWTVTRQGDQRRLCVGLEDVDRGLSSAMSLDEIARRKVYAETAIPVGEYGVVFTKSPKFGHVPWLTHVPGYSSIYIHAGNRNDDTRGCLLPGTDEGHDVVTGSVAALIAVESIILAAARRGEAVRVRIEREAEPWARFSALHPEITGYAAPATGAETRAP